MNLDRMTECEILNEQAFLKMLCLERKRTERSHRRFVLMLLQSVSLLKRGNSGVFEKVLQALSHSTRETDIKGWYVSGSTIGIIFTEIGAAEGGSVVHALLTKVSSALCSSLGIEQIREINISFHVFPENQNAQDSGGSTDSHLYPDLVRTTEQRRASRIAKRSMDIVGSLLALAILSPLLILISLGIKLGSKGPVFFRQKRLGQYGKSFTFLKFRSMYSRNNPKIHEEYVRQFILGRPGSEKAEQSQPKVYKLTNDPRVTRFGRLLRRTSLDELPQFMNVLRGEMSLVGPRPPIPYEFEHYDIWHKQRLLAVKPGITGLWQVEGRSRLKFDEMVRLDLRYARSWSLWLDIKILLHTPRAVLTGAGAY